MVFDPKYKEKARAEDAVDRLRDVHDRLREDEARRAERRDQLIRAVIVCCAALAVLYAFSRL